MEDLPKFNPISDCPTITDEEFEEMFRCKDPATAAAIERCKQGDETALLLVQDLIKSGVHPGNLQQCLINAVSARDTSLVEGLLVLGIPIACSARDLAIDLIALDILSSFVAHGWDLNTETAWCYPAPLALALEPPVIDASLVAWFLDHGANPNQPCGMDMTPLSIGVQFAPLHILTSLLARCSDTIGKGQLLHHAARRRSDDGPAVMERVLQRFPQFRVNDIMYHDHAFSFEVRKTVGLGTALHEAAKFGVAATILWLLNHGAEIDARDSRGQTPLQVARAYKNFAAIDCLERAGQSRGNA